MTLQIVIIVAIFILGACFGSFTSAAIYRFHHKEHKLLNGRSICPQCKKPLAARDLVPLISFLALRGRCRYCDQEISYMYPALELLFGGLLLAVYFKFPFISDLLEFDGATLLAFALFAFYTFVLLFTFFFDLKYMHVADEILLPGILIGLLSPLVPGMPNLVDLLMGIAIGAGFFALQYAISKGKWVGAGDIRIGAFMGVALGWQLTIIALVLSYVLGSIISIILAVKQHKFRGIKIPFAPFLVTGTFIVLFFGNDILTWYLKLLGV